MAEAVDAAFEDAGDAFGPKDAEKPTSGAPHSGGVNLAMQRRHEHSGMTGVPVRRVEMPVPPVARLP